MAQLISLDEPSTKSASVKWWPWQWVWRIRRRKTGREAFLGRSDCDLTSDVLSFHKGESPNLKLVRCGGILKFLVEEGERARAQAVDMAGVNCRDLLEPRVPLLLSYSPIQRYSA